jgi:Dolichyl-phosphate-mannose-protein mannosyltransferase
MGSTSPARLEALRRPTVWYGSAIAVIVLIATVIRFYDIDASPVFFDEDIYSRAAVGMMHLPIADALTSFPAGWEKSTDKTPWLFIARGQISLATNADVVDVGRWMSAFLGVVATGLSFFLGRRLNGTATGMVTAALYAVSPLAVLHDRMVLQDGPMACFALGYVLVSWEAIERRSWLWATAGTLIGAMAVQLKVPAVTFAPVVLLMAGVAYRRLADVPRLGLFLAAGPVASYFILLASPFGLGLTDQNSTYFQPFSPAMGSVLRDFWDDVNVYLPSGLWILVVLGIIISFFRRPRVAVVLVAAIAVSTVPWLVFSRFAPSRYFLPAIPFVCSFGAIAFVRLCQVAMRANRVLGAFVVVALVAVFMTSVVNSVREVTDFRSAVLTTLDDWQFRTGWPSGSGYQEARAYISTTAEPGSVVYYVVDQRHFSAIGMDRPLPPGVVAFGVLDAGNWQPDPSRSPSYFVIDDLDVSRIAGKLNALSAHGLNFRQTASFLRPGSDEGVYIFRVP